MLLVRNEGRTLSRSDAIRAWIAKYRDWQARVKEEMSTLSAAQAELFETRDWITERFTEQNPGERTMLLNKLSDQLEDLKQFIERLEPVFDKNSNS